MYVSTLSLFFYFQMAGSTESGGGARTVCIMPCASRGGSMLSLRHPKSGEQASYILMGDDLCELNWFKQSFGSWFLGDYVCEDGGFYICTPVDPIFVLLPLFDFAHMSNSNDQGKFRQLDELLYVDGYPGYQNLISIARNQMQMICDVKEIGSELFYRLDDSKVLSWLYCKVEQLKKTFPKLGKNYAAQEERELLKDIILMLGEYVKEPWLKLLCRQLKIDIEEVYANPSESTVASVSGETTPMPFKTTEVNGGNKSDKSTKGRPPKKLKTQVESQNIKDMFRRVTRSGTK
ncbi:Ribonuclease H2 subunit B [Rhynchospora pubera]|uniref:Ribonuclease H2 subunit B n=2 Tax=Rhynchospora pubera TaxID=906938 RepID=A0AAV8GIW9_9POAL|nr:Ribonuclease H2 subunit B [Rhynchospora pubera]